MKTDWRDLIPYAAVGGMVFVIVYALCVFSVISFLYFMMEVFNLGC